MWCPSSAAATAADPLQKPSTPPYARRAVAIDLDMGSVLDLVADAVRRQRVHPLPRGRGSRAAAGRVAVRVPGGAAAADRLGAESRSSRGRCGLAERFPNEDPANLQRVALFYEIARSRRQLVEALRERGAGRQAALAGAARARRARLPARDHDELRPAVRARARAPRARSRA